jgi:hypothetical protein
MKTTVTVLQKAIFWNRHVAAKARNAAQKTRCLKRIDRLEAELATAIEDIVDDFNYVGSRHHY